MKLVRIRKLSSTPISRECAVFRPAGRAVTTRRPPSSAPKEHQHLDFGEIHAGLQLQDDDDEHTTREHDIIPRPLGDSAVMHAS